MLAGAAGSIQRLRTLYPNRAQATAAAKAAWARAQRGQATFSLTLASGRADIYPEQRLRTHGWPPLIDHTPWIIAKVQQRLDSGGFRTTLDCETAASADQAGVHEAGT